MSPLKPTHFSSSLTGAGGIGSLTQSPRKGSSPSETFSIAKKIDTGIQVGRMVEANGEGVVRAQSSLWNEAKECDFNKRTIQVYNSCS